MASDSPERPRAQAGLRFITMAGSSTGGKRAIFMGLSLALWAQLPEASSGLAAIP